MYNGRMTAAIFLDRDGVIIENRDNYVLNWDHVHIFPWAIEALSLLSALPIKIILVTNQSAIGRKLVSSLDVQQINQRLCSIITAGGGRIDDVLMCPHSPGAHCLCRKPQPGMLFTASTRHQINLSHSVMVGDAVSDLMAGFAAGVKETILLRTGRGNNQLSKARSALPGDFLVFNDLLQASHHFLQLFN